MIQAQTGLLPQKLPANIPPMPVEIRYYDDFSDTYGHVKDPGSTDQWSISLRIPVDVVR